VLGVASSNVLLQFLATGYEMGRSDFADVWCASIPRILVCDGHRGNSCCLSGFESLMPHHYRLGNFWGGGGGGRLKDLLMQAQHIS
jgi:hypothetical protein